MFSCVVRVRRNSALMMRYVCARSCMCREWLCNPKGCTCLDFQNVGNASPDAKSTYHPGTCNSRINVISMNLTLRAFGVNILSVEFSLMMLRKTERTGLHVSFHIVRSEKIQGQPSPLPSRHMVRHTSKLARFMYVTSFLCSYRAGQNTSDHALEFQSFRRVA